VLGDEFVEQGKWHFGRKNGKQFCLGYETAEEAEETMASYVWSVLEEYGWP